MKRELILLGIALVGGAGTGWLTASPPAVESSPGVFAAPSPIHGGAAAAEARRRLSDLDLAGGAVPLDVAAPPPPPDVALLFRRDLTAIEQRPEGTIVWIVDFTRDFGRRGMRIGDIYQDGWRLSGASSQWVELRRRREVRRIAVFDLPPDVQP